MRHLLAAVRSVERLINDDEDENDDDDDDSTWLISRRRNGRRDTSRGGRGGRDHRLVSTDWKNRISRDHNESLGSW